MKKKYSEHSEIHALELPFQNHICFERNLSYSVLHFILKRKYLECFLLMFS